VGCSRREAESGDVLCIGCKEAPFEVVLPAPRQEEAPITPSAVTAQPHTPPEIASDQHILDRFANALPMCGVVGEDRNAKLFYLALTSRVLDEPVSLAAKGVSGVGKSHTLDTVLRFFPESAYVEMTAMSERALVYSKDDFQHRTIVLFEAVALREQREKTESNLTAYFVRSLLSEGRIRYPVTVRDKEGNFVTKTIQKDGPTNLIVTTTAISLHGENETRLISVSMNDSSAQTRAVFRQIAEGPSGTANLDPWRAFQGWLETAEHRVSIPYARHLADVIPSVAVRLRRDFKALLRLIETHAILHQLNRERDQTGRIVATEEDYLAVRDLVADLISDGVGATVPRSVRETVDTVRDLVPVQVDGVTVHAVAGALRLDRSTAQRRIQAARERGYLVNLEERRGRMGRYDMGEPMPDELDLLPHTLTAHRPECPGQDGVCTCAPTAEVRKRPPPGGSVDHHGNGTPGFSGVVQAVRAFLEDQPDAEPQDISAELGYADVTVTAALASICEEGAVRCT
jgi:hypothetical protein